jgi:UDP-GlcNAc:undecaprenyl-phosphate GlcNAc-1-phosphate transferase
MNDTPRYLLAFGVPLLGALVLTPVMARIARRSGMMDRPHAGRFHSTATPYLGGIAIAGGLLLVSVFVSGAREQLVAILLCALAVTLLGLADDLRGVGPMVKVCVEAGLGLVLWLVGIRAGLFGVPVLDLALTIAWVVAVTNAVNILDNMDGVAAGVSAVCAFGLAAIAAGQGEYLVASLALAVAGGCLGFLPYNFPPARIFLGDAGSLLLGFSLAAIGLKLDLIGPTSLVRAIVPALALAVPLFDMTLVMIARWRDGRPVYLGATDHTAHRLHARGVRPTRIALLAYAAQGACSAVAFIISRTTDGIAWASFGLIVPLAAVLLALLLRTQGDAITHVPDVDGRVDSRPVP